MVKANWAKFWKEIISGIWRNIFPPIQRRPLTELISNASPQIRLYIGVCISRFLSGTFNCIKAGHVPSFSAKPVWSPIQVFVKLNLAIQIPWSDLSLCLNYEALLLISQTVETWASEVWQILPQLINLFPPKLKCDPHVALCWALEGSLNCQPSSENYFLICQWGYNINWTPNISEYHWFQFWEYIRNNKLAKLQATLVRNYDLPTYRVAHGGEV